MLKNYHNRINNNNNNNKWWKENETSWWHWPNKDLTTRFVIGSQKCFFELHKLPTHGGTCMLLKCFNLFIQLFIYFFPFFPPLQRNLDKLLSEKFCSPTITYLEDKGKFLFSDVYALIWWDRNLIPLIVWEFTHNANETTRDGSEIYSHLRNLFSNVLS